MPWRQEWPEACWGEDNCSRQIQGFGKGTHGASARGSTWSNEQWWWQSAWEGESKDYSPESASLSSESSRVAWSGGEARKSLESEKAADTDDSYNIQVAGKSLLPMQAFESLLKFILSHQLDSFALEEYLNSSPENCCFIEESKRLLLNFPASCPCACRFQFEELLDEPGSLKARQKLVATILNKLFQEGFIGDDLQRSAEKIKLKFNEHIAPWQDTCTIGGEEFRIRLSSSSWKNNISLYVINSDIINSQFGFLSHVASNFCYHIKCQGHKVCVETYQVGWDNDRSILLEQFNQQLLLCYPTMTDLRLVQVFDNSIDFEGMEEFCKDQGKLDHIPLLCELAWKLDRLSWWETARNMVPTEPGPSSLKLHIIFDCDDKDSQDTREALAIVGEDALRFAAAVACSEENPAWTGEQLERQVQQFLNKQFLAELAVRNKMPQHGERKGIGVNEASEMLLALIGSLKLESDMFAVASLWSWLTGNAVLHKANLHTSALPHYQGRTPSYIELGETEPLDDDSGSGITWLKVRYEDYDDSFYRWRGCRAEELRSGIPGSKWEALVWDTVLATFCSPSMLHRNGNHRPLPNKVVAWLRGRPINKLVSIKNKIAETAMCTTLREEVDELLGEKHSWLLVKYFELDRHVAYRRSAEGGLGYEIFQMKGEKASTTRHVGYSESRKTLISQALSGWPLPSKVVTWLLEPCCLADLIPMSKKASAGVELSYELGKASWTSPTTGNNYTIRTEPVSVGVIYTVKVVDSDEWQAIAYSEEQREWVVDGEIQEVVPSAALKHLSLEVSKIISGEYMEGQPVDFIVPHGKNQRSNVFFPQLSGSDFLELELTLHYHFCKPRLLAEALTHCSAKRTVTASCEHLAIVGYAAVCSFTSDFMLRSNAVPWFLAALINRKEEIETLGGGSWLAGSSSSRDKQQNKPLILSLDDFKSCHRSCCNHTSFAFSCVKLGLHKAMNRTPTCEFEDAILNFVSRSAKSLAELLQGGAPKALGDVFLACLGAVIMDSEYTEAISLLEQHFEDCFGFTSIMKPRPHTMERIRDIRDDMFEKVTLAHFPRTAIHSKMVTEPFGDIHYVRSLLCCSDVALVEVDNELYMTTTPRAALVTALVKTDVKSPGEGPILEAGTPYQTLQPLELNDAIFCRYCEMWLNGPGQWKDHEIGKKHRIQVRKLRAVPKEAFEGQRIPPVPLGFGKLHETLDKVVLSCDATQLQ